MIRNLGTRHFARTLLAFACLLVVALLPACGGGGDDTLTLVEVSVAVGPGGGFANVEFDGSSGQRVKIRLAGPANTEPYGFLEAPSSAGSYAVPNTGAGPVNEAEVTLPVSGRYTLTVFDGTNRGGTIAVTITVLD